MKRSEFFVKDWQICVLYLSNQKLKRESDPIDKSVTLSVHKRCPNFKLQKDIFIVIFTIKSFRAHPDHTGG